MKNNFLNTFTKFLKQLNVPVTESSALEYLETHPEDGSMLAYADALNHFKIENAAIRIKEDDLITLPTPFIAFLQIHGGTFSVVKNLTENTIEWFDTQRGWVSDKLEDFTKTWNGVVLLAEIDEKSGEKNYTSKRRDEILRNIRIPIAVALIAFSFLFFIINAPLVSTPTYILLGLKIIGMVISTLLFVKSIDNANSLVNKLCNAGSKISCQSILDSPAAKITPWFSWSDAGFIYFFGSFMAMLFSLYDASYLLSYWTLQLFFSGFAILFSGYSLYYQGIRAKMWCTLCLGVVAVFVLEALVLTLIFDQASKISSTFGPKLVVLLSIPIIFLLLFKNEMTKSIESKRLKKELSRIKSNHKIITALMESQKIMPIIHEGIGVVSIGNKEAENVLTIISNPLCTPCAKMHQRIEKVLQKAQNLRCNIVFLSNKDDAGGMFVRKILSLPPEFQEKAISLWYRDNNSNFNEWNKKYLDYKEKIIAEVYRNEHNNWVDIAEIKSTPSLFYNSKKLVQIINVEDLDFISMIKNQ